MIAKADFDTCTHTNGIDTWFPFLPMEHHTMTEDRPSAFLVYCAYVYCAYVYCACEAAFGSPHSRYTSVQVLSLVKNMPLPLISNRKAIIVIQRGRRGLLRGRCSEGFEGGERLVDLTSIPGMLKVQPRRSGSYIRPTS